jgi:chemotaxis signal transduction protein
MVLFSVAGSMFAIPARSVEEIREIAGLREFPSRLARVKHTVLRQGKCYFVVDAARHFRMSSQQPGKLMLLRHAPVAVLVDAIDRMQEIQSIHELPAAFGGDERNWYRGLTLIKGKVVPVVHPESFLSKAEVTLLSVLLRGKRSAEAAAVTA